MMLNLIMVGFGGAAGAMLRYGMGQLAARLAGPGFPYATLSVNLIGSFLIGVVIMWLAQSGSQRYAPFVVTGVLGGFTTFSAFSLDLVTMIERGNVALAVLYATGSVLGGVALVFAGIAVARLLIT